MYNGSYLTYLDYMYSLFIIWMRYSLYLNCAWTILKALDPKRSLSGVRQTFLKSHVGNVTDLISFCPFLISSLNWHRADFFSLNSISVPHKQKSTLLVYYTWLHHTLYWNSTRTSAQSVFFYLQQQLKKNI